MHAARVFPGLAAAPWLVGVARLLLVSLVYQFDYLVATLPPTHALFSSVLVTDPTMRSTLKPLLAPMEASEMMISGVPPYVEIYRKIKAVYDKLTTYPEELFGGVRRILDNTMAAGHITRAVLDKALRAVVASVRAEAQAASPTAPAVYSPQEPSQRCGDGWLQYRRLPEAFELPRVNVAEAWRLWWYGDAAQHHPPYRNIAPYELGAKKKRDMLVEWKHTPATHTEYTICDLDSSFVDNMTDKENAILNDMLATAIHSGGSQFTLVASAEWQAFLSRLRPGFKIPTPEAIGGQLLDDSYQRVQTATMAAVSKLHSLCITLDGTTLQTGKPILNIMLCGPHGFFVEHFTLDNARETAANLLHKVKSVKDMCNDYFLAAQLNKTTTYGFLAAPETRLWSLCTDSPSVMVSLRRLAVADHTVSFAFGCAPHALNNMCLDWMKVPSIKSTIASGVAIVTGVRRVHLLLAAFDTLCSQQLQQQLTLVLFTKTRWSTCRAMLQRLLRVQHVLQFLPMYIRRPGSAAASSLPAALEATLLDATLWGQFALVDALLAPVCAALTFLSGDEATHSSVYACFLAVAVAVKELTVEALEGMGIQNHDVLLAAVIARFASIYSSSMALAFVTDPLFCGMRQRLTTKYGTAFTKEEFALWLARPHTTDHFFVDSRTKPHLLWAMMDDSCLSNLAPLLVQVHAMSTGAVSGERNHKTTKRFASPKRSRIGFYNAQRQVAIAFNGKQLARVHSTSRESKYIDHLVSLGAVRIAPATGVELDQGPDDEDGTEENFPFVEDIVAAVDEFLVEVDWATEDF
ncbi:hypothetical protein ACHHYP_11771 [Achlya hypogyna]|uniref:DUF659 domain-containing protein n=1 Tax=Achlya hypogyna TaxID=1202772 RepID=A0A1V9YII9_ACHHY|nr:hypothetical protein ACHHYP_11771 [Achlya hypogyna]